MHATICPRSMRQFLTEVWGWSLKDTQRSYKVINLGIERKTLAKVELRTALIDSILWWDMRIDFSLFTSRLKHDNR